VKSGWWFGWTLARSLDGIAKLGAGFKSCVTNADGSAARSRVGRGRGMHRAAQADPDRSLEA
jgi:hypothetical protein